MAREVSAELKSFKEAVGPNITAMNKCTSDIASKIDELTNSINSSKSEIETAYVTSGDNKAVTKFTNTSEIVLQMKSDIESTISGALGKANSLIEKITALEELATKIKTSEAAVSRESSKTEVDEAALASARSNLSSLEKEFDNNLPEAESLLAELKSLDKSADVGSVDTSSESTNNNLNTYTEYLTNLKYGSFTHQQFEDSNHNVIDYYLYVPDNVENISGLPVMLYMHGAGKDSTQSSCLNYGLPNKIMNQEINPQGIVICPFIKNHTSDETLTTLKELTDNVVSTYNADSNRVSLSGHSYGAMVAYKLVNEYPDTYSAVVPISGWDEVTDAFKTTKVWAFHGVYDNQGDQNRHTTYNGQVNAVNSIKNIGGTAEMTTLKMGHAYTQNKTYETTYLSPDGIEENPLDWAFRQKKS